MPNGPPLASPLILRLGPFLLVPPSFVPVLKPAIFSSSKMQKARRREEADRRYCISIPSSGYSSEFRIDYCELTSSVRIVGNDRLGSRRLSRLYSRRLSRFYLVIIGGLDGADGAVVEVEGELAGELLVMELGEEDEELGLGVTVVGAELRDREGAAT